MKRSFAFPLAIAMVVVWQVRPGLAQRGTGELRLGVKDGTGAPVAAAIDLMNDSTRTRQTVELTLDGHYTFKNLPFGLYRVTVAHAGFATANVPIEIRSEVPQTREIVLGIQPVETALQVTDSATLVDPNRTGTAYYVGANDVQERRIGLPGRDLIDLIAQQPGWFLEANGSLHPRESEYQAQYIVNGFPIQDNRSPALSGGLEAGDVQSMKVYTSGIPAEYGRKLGGVIEVTTDRNSTPGFRGTAGVQGGSFATAGGSISGQYTAGKNTGTLSAEGFATDRYLDPPVQANFSNHGSHTAFTGTVERDFTEADRVRVSAAHHQTWFEAPNELLQEMAGQRQDRTSSESLGQVSWQHVFGATMVGAVRGMVRDVNARLWSNALSTPIAAAQDRGFREGYFNASLSGHRGRHEWKAGGEASFAAIREAFSFQLTAYQINGIRIFDKDTPQTFAFHGRARDREQSAYVQDLLRLGSVTLSAGLRFDHYHLLVDERGFSPRLGVSWSLPRLGLALHTSYDRIFGTPAFENILVSADRNTLSLNNAGLYLPLRPSRGNYYEAGFTQAIAKRLRLEANIFRRDISNFPDDDLLVNTGVSFPIAFHSAQIRGVEVKLEAPRWGPVSGFISYSNMIGVGRFPIAGGLFLDDTAPQLLTATDRFPVTQDQRNTARAALRFQLSKRLWTSWTASYNSGLPVQNLGQPLDFLAAQYGSAVLAHVNFDAGRVRPNFALDASVGADLWRKEKRSVAVQADILNVTGRLNVINFAGLLSGTALAPPRSLGIRLRVEF